MRYSLPFDWTQPLRVGPHHDGPVLSVASVALPDGRVLILSGAGDQTVRRWDAVTGEPVGDPLTGHTGPVNSVASVALPDGRVLILSGAGDRTVRRWDAVTGEPVGDPLTGHTDWVWSVASVALPGGRVLILSGADDRTVRRWDAVSGEPVGDPLTGHTGAVWSVASVALPGGRVLIVSGGADWSLVLWPVLRTGQIAGEPTPPRGTRGISRTDEMGEASFKDVLGRGVLAAHLEELLVQLTDKHRAGTAVIHVDGRWGSGKSKLITLLEHRMTGTPAAGEAHLRDPILVRYDAWRESAVAPEWWSLSTAINRSVRRQRALAARLAMTLVSAATRMVRSVPVVVAAVLLAGTLAARSAGIWSGDIRGLGTTLTVLTAVATVGLALGRALFWSAPAFGRLYLRSDDNPLGEIAAVVASLRRWSPRRGRGGRLAESVFAFGLAAGIAWIAAVYRSVLTVRVGVAGIPTWSASHARPLCAAAVAAVLMGGAFLGKQRRAGPGDGAAPRRRRRVVRLVPWRVRNRLSRIARDMRSTSVRLVRLVRSAAGWVAVMLWKLILGPDRPPTGGSRPSPLLATILMAAGGGISGYALFSLAPSASLWTTVQRSPYLWTLAPITLVLAAFLIWTAARTSRPRRPLLLVIDDLDRCPAERVVKLLETVHTLLRERPDVQIFPAWRKAAPFVVLVLGDGRWIRQSFETGYETFQALGSGVHGLGADFLQKVFDHVVLVPALAADQVQAYVDDVTEVSHWVVAGPRQTQPPAPTPTSTRSSNAAPPPAAQPADARTGRKGHALPTDAEDVTSRATADMESKDQQAPVEDPPATDSAPATQEAERVIAATSPGQVLSSQVQQAIGHAPPEDRQRLAEDAAGKAASKEAMAAFSEHLLAAHAPIMPANPRLVTRVANTFGMLMVLRIHLGHHEPEDYIARAAIVFVRFPTLVDTLLSDPDPPTIDPTTAPTDADTKDTTSSPWFRRDVQHVLRDEHNQLIDIVRLARCFGREYEPAIPTPTPAATGSTPAAQTDITKPDGATAQPQRQHDDQRTRR